MLALSPVTGPEVRFADLTTDLPAARFWPVKGTCTTMGHRSYAGRIRSGFRVRTELTRLNLILQADRPEHRTARARSSTCQQPTLQPGFWFHQWCRGHHDSRHAAIQVCRWLSLLG